ncbi:glycosyltransferase family 2 protein [Litoreibacter roseus]|uniref:Glycosyltransferase 2-like domain-containing protein n=1 Tax=Litoreibacter roseus TaxID=2601869 RepID=A0A6N6JA19_9RHOB|nr:glycosyltransferase [Litoreibacter roseus]GFE63091.1 hypothetical protein KIN_01650 [Litoreibacter roseus]
MTGKDLDIDVVVPAFRCRAELKACLEGLLDAGAPAERIIVVDDASGDDTPEAARAAGVQLIALDKNVGPAAARNRGVAAATADLVLFVDADVVVAGDVLDRVRAAFSADAGLSALFGAYDTKPAAPGRISRIRNLLHHWNHDRAAGGAVTFWTGLGAVRHDAFDAVGGFDETLDYMEDVDLGMRIWRQGGRIQIDPAIQGKHLKNWSFRSMMRTDFWGRAVPWSRLIMNGEFKDVPKTLNAGRRGQLSVIAVAVSVFALILMPISAFFLAVVICAIGLIGWLHSGFLRLLKQVGEPGDRLAALGVLWLLYLTAGFGFVWVIYERVAGRVPNQA